MRLDNRKILCAPDYRTKYKSVLFVVHTKIILIKTKFVLAMYLNKLKFNQLKMNNHKQVFFFCGRQQGIIQKLKTVIRLDN